MADDTTDQLRRHQKVTAGDNVLGVPPGTKGKILLVNGMGPWIRYRVLFANGVERGNVLRESLSA